MSASSSGQWSWPLLEAFVDEEKDDIDVDEMHEWHDKLLQFDTVEQLTPHQTENIIKAFKLINNFYYTAADELRDVAEKEAVAAADRESAMQEQLAATREELDELRERLTVGADVSRGGESIEAFRAQVSALKEENYLLQQTSRERDREMADQRDRFENVLARADALHRERDNLIYNKSQLEETIGELNRRLKTKTEGGEHEWEMKKLRQRNEQAIQLTGQLNAVLSQNESLREEVQRVSAALEDATRLIETTTLRYDDLSQRLLTATARIAELEGEKERAENEVAEMKAAEEARLAADGEAQQRLTYERNIAELKSTLALRDQEIGELRSHISSITEQLEWAEAKAQVGTEKEDHLEQLRLQLQKATKEAKHLLGYTSTTKDEDDKPVDGEDTATRRALIQTQHVLQIAQAQLDERIEEIRVLETEMEEKDRRWNDVNDEVNKLREIKLGDAAKIVTELRLQLQYRDEQIARLNHQCSLLHVELGRYARMEEEGLLKSRKKEEVEKYKDERAEEEHDKGEIDKKKKGRRTYEREADDEEQVEARNIEEAEKKKKRRKPGEKEKEIAFASSYEEQAMLISNLYYEAMLLIKELEQKDKLLEEAEMTVMKGSTALDQCREQLRLAYIRIEEIELRSDDVEENADEEDTVLIKTELQHLRIFADSVRQGGTELERRAEEMNRKLIGENLERMRTSKRLMRVEKRLEMESGRCEKLIQRMLKLKAEQAHAVVVLQRQLDDAWSSEARLQRVILECVPRNIYTALHDKYVKIIRSSAHLNDSSREIPTPAETIIPDILPKASDQNEEAAEGTRKQLQHTKRLLEIVEEQAAFWQGESESLQRENAELRSILEQCEEDSDASAILISMETHLLRALREQAELAREGLRARELLNKARREYREEKGAWASERRHLIAVARLLHSTLERSKTEILHGISISQVELFLSKIEQVMEDDRRIKQRMEKVEELQRETEESRTKAAALQQALDLMQQSEGDRATIERALHSLITREMQLKQQLALAQQQAKESKAETERIINSSSSTDEERKMILEKVGVMLELREAAERDGEDRRTSVTKFKDESRNTTTQATGSNGSTKSQPSLQPSQSVLEQSSESSTESDVDTDAEKNALQRETRIVVKTVVHDNTKKFEERISQMKETAEICIRGYKDLLDQKQRALVDMRKLLEKKMNETKIVEKVHVVERVIRETDESVAEKLVNAMKEAARLNRLVEELQQANAQLYERVKHNGDDGRAEMGVQTDFFEEITRENTEHEEDGGTAPSERSYRRETAFKEVDRTTRADGEGSSEKERSEKMKAEEDLRKLTARYQFEKRNNRETIAKLTKANKELTRACEEIKKVAMEEMKEKITSRGETSVARDEQLRAARDEADSLRKVINRLKKTVESQRRELDNKELNVNRHGLSVEQWTERKNLEEIIEKLRKETRVHQERQRTIDLEISRRDKRITELEANDRLRITVISQLENQLRSSRSDKSSKSTSQVADISEVRLRLKLTEEQLSAARKELNDARIRISHLVEQRGEKEKKIVTIKSPTKEKPTEPPLRREPSHLGKANPSTERKEIIELRTKLSTTMRSYNETREKLVRLEKEHKETIEKHRLIVVRLEKDATPVSAIALLHDKIQAKELEIRQLKHRMADMQRTIDNSQ